jgi:hypothetical protein
MCILYQKNISGCKGRLRLLTGGCSAYVIQKPAGKKKTPGGGGQVQGERRHYETRGIIHATVSSASCIFIQLRQKWCSDERNMVLLAPYLPLSGFGGMGVSGDWELLGLDGRGAAVTRPAWPG